MSELPHEPHEHLAPVIPIRKREEQVSFEGLNPDELSNVESVNLALAQWSDPKTANMHLAEHIAKPSFVDQSEAWDERLRQAVASVEIPDGFEAEIAAGKHPLLNQMEQFLRTTREQEGDMIAYQRRAVLRLMDIYIMVATDTTGRLQIDDIRTVLERIIPESKA